MNVPDIEARLDRVGPGAPIVLSSAVEGAMAGESSRSFIYSVTLINRSDQSVRVLGRKWLLRDDKGNVSVIEGEGVVGEIPVLEGGDAFSYTSQHIVTSDTTARGAYFCEWADGKREVVPLAEFQMKIES